MNRLLRFSTSGHGASAAALRTSATLPDFDIPFVNNSQGASAAAAELSTALGEAIHQLNLEGQVSDELSSLVHRLDQEASKYDNSKVADDDMHRKWECSESLAQVVALSWRCALGVYSETKRTLEADYFVLEEEHAVTPSLGGTVKALTSTLVMPKPGSSSANDFIPVLVVAIRGSASRWDHMVNANSQPRDAREFLRLHAGETPGLLAHSGFLNSAVALGEVVTQRISKYVKSCRETGEPPRKLHVLFTGHSAGGAVASLLFYRYLHLEQYASVVRLSCITFGSPPCVSQALEIDKFTASGSAVICLNIINELDTVSRADKPYTISLVNLLRSMYGLELLPLEQEVDGRAAAEPGTVGAPPPVSNVWPVPRLFYHHIGSRIVLLMRVGEEDVQLRAVEVPGEQWEKLLFCRISVHRRVSYEARIKLIEEGRFNDITSWKGVRADGECTNIEERVVQ